jgi:hypothetical protein
MTNRLLGRKKRTLFCQGFDRPILLDPETALSKIAYIYTNPAKDNLEESIEKYPGLSSYQMYKSGQHKQHWKRVCRWAFEEIEAHQHNLRGYNEINGRVLATSKTSHVFRIEPDAWLESFGITDTEEKARWNERVMERIRQTETIAADLRALEGKTVIGAERLKHQVFDTTYRPNRSGRKMWCLSINKAQRQAFIAYLKQLFAEARRIYGKWKAGDFSEKYPPGLFPPSMPKLANVLYGW